MYKKCSTRGCPHLVKMGTRFCASCEKFGAKWNQGRKRKSSAKRGYNRSWRAVREAYVRAHPLCEDCKMEGRVQAAEEVHHVRAIVSGGKNIKSNLLSLCRFHHRIREGMSREQALKVERDHDRARAERK